MIVVVFEEEFIITNYQLNMADSWSIIFYIMSCMMDLLSIINYTSLIKFLEQE